MPRALRALAFVACTPALRLAVFLSLAALAGLPMLDQAAGMNLFHDAQFLSAYERHARIAALRYGQLPLWDPYSCGGLYGLAAPQTRYATPFFLLSLLFDVDPAAGMLGVLLPALGMEGMLRYARSWGASPLSAFLCAPLFPLCGWFATAWHVGWVQFLSFCGLPWILYGLRGALRGVPSGALVCALASALTVGFGGTWTLPMGALLAGFELLAALLPRALLWPRAPAGAPWRSRAARVLGRLAGATALLVGVGAYRLWPMLESTAATLRVMGGEPTSSLARLAQALFMPNWVEAADRDSYYMTPLIALALACLTSRRWLVPWMAASGMFGLALGHVAPYAPFALLRRLPLYDTIRYPERCLVLFALGSALLTACGASSLVARARGRWGQRGARRARFGLVCLFALGIGSQIRNAQLIAADVSLEATPALGQTGFRQSRGNRWLMSHFAAEGMGSLACGEAYPLPMSRHLRGDLAQEEYLVPLEGAGEQDEARGLARAQTPHAQLGKVRRLAWSPNALALQVDAARPVRLAINQNYHPGWRSSRGKVESWDGLLSVVLPPGQQRVELSFVPRSGIGGMAVSLLSLLAGALLLLRPPGAAAARAACLASGPLLLLALLTLWPEPPWRHPEPTTPDGRPVLLARLPADARAQRVRFQVPLVLEGVRIAAPERALGGRVLPIELFFRREGPLSASLGIFVHLRRPGKKPIYGDHAEISGQLYLPRMPLGQLARDAFRVLLPEGARGEWEISFGLWNAHTDRERVPIVAAEGMEQRKNAAVLGHISVP